MLTEAHSATNVHRSSRSTGAVTADTRISQRRFLVGI